MNKEMKTIRIETPSGVVQIDETHPQFKHFKEMYGVEE